MRRVSTIVVCTLILQGVMASSANAWWDGFEHLSGPGPFFGVDVQLRLFCLVQPAGKNTTEARTSTPIGAILSVCRADKSDKDRSKRDKERLMIDLGARFMRTTKYENQTVPEFANGHEIDFTTLEPAVMFPIAEKGWFRLDYGFGAGVYWFSSEGFEAFHGAFIEPVRLDGRFGLPQNRLRIDAIVARVGWVNFPAGFDLQKFAGGPGHDGRIDSDWAKTLSLFVDLTPAAYAAGKKLGFN